MSLAPEKLTAPLIGVISMCKKWVQLVERVAGRGSPNKVPFVEAVSMNDTGHPIALKFSPVSGFTSDAIVAWAKRSLLPGTLVFSDGLGCFPPVTDVGCLHTQHASRVIGDWINFYNHQRPHQALGMKTPAAAFALAG